MLHPRLQRQLKRLGLADRQTAPSGEPWLQLLELVSQTYDDADRERYNISSEELQRLHEGLTAEKRLLEMTANGSPLHELLAALARAVEERSDDALCSICLLDGDQLRRGAAPSLPDSYSLQIDGLVIGPSVGSCGTAAFHGKPVIVSDIASDPLWADFRDVALGHGLRACWSTPISSRKGEVLGTFAMYYREPREPGEGDLRLIESSTHIAAIAIESRRAEAALRESEERLRAVVTNTSVVLFAMDREGIFTLSEGRGLEALGLKPGEVMGMSVYDVYHDEPDVLENIRRAFAGEEFTEMVEVSGPGLTFETRFAPIRDENGEVIGLSGVATNVTERKQAEEALRESEATLKATIESTEDGLLVIKSDGQISYANARFAEMWRVPQDLLEAKDNEKLLAFALEQLECPDAFLAKVRELSQTRDVEFDTLLFKDGRVFESYTHSLTDRSGAAGLVWNFRDVTERRRAEEQLRSHAEELEDMNQRLVAAHEQLAQSQEQLRQYATRLERTVDREHKQAVTDAVTGLANHRGAHVQLEALAQETRRKQQPLSLVLGDIDSFKLFNDTYGHACGDEILKLVGDVCREVSQDPAVPCRFGGDEFLVVLPGEGRASALETAARISALLDQREFTTSSSDRIPVSLSLGVATMPQDADTVEKLVAAADAAMYDAKRRGKATRGSHVADALTADTTYGVLDSLVQAIDAKDHYTKRHSDVVAEYAARFAGCLNLSKEAQRALRTAGLLHDVGKLVVPDEILKKPGPLTSDEYELVKRHVAIGEVLIREVPQLDDVIQAVSCHHERFDGTGYPRGLKGKELPLLGRVIAVADAYSAMILDRPYRKALSLDHVVGQLENGAGRQFDPELVPVFVRLVQEEAAARRRAA